MATYTDIYRRVGTGTFTGFAKPKPVISRGPGSVPSVPPARGPGLRVRLRRIAGSTDKTALESALYLQMGPLGDFTVSETGEHIEYRTLASGEFSAPATGRGAAARSLRSCTIQTLTLNWDAPWLVNRDITPREIRNELDKLLRLRTPFELLVTRSLPEHGGSNHEILMNVTLRAIERTLKAREADTRYYDLAFREWRKATIGRRGSGSSRGGGGTRSKNTPGPGRGSTASKNGAGRRRGG